MHPDVYSQKPFSRLVETDPSSALYGAVLHRINLEVRRTARTRFWLFSGVALASGIALVPAVVLFLSDLHRSGFYEYFVLFLSDGGTILASWKDFALSLAESAPLLGMTAVLGALFIFLGSLRYVARDAKTAFMRARFI